MVNPSPPILEIHGDDVTVEATYLAARLGLPVDKLLAEMQRGIVYSRVERGIGEDAGQLRLTFRYRARAWTVIVQRASGFEWDEPPTCGECRQGGNIKRWQRLVIDKQTWDGDDIFLARGLAGTIFASQQFKNWCEDNKVTNVSFLPSEQSRQDYCPWEKVSPAQE